MGFLATVKAGLTGRFGRRIIGLSLLAASTMLGLMDGCDEDSATLTIDAPRVTANLPPASYEVTVFDELGEVVVEPTRYLDDEGSPIPELSLSPGCYQLEMVTSSPTRPGVVVWFQSYTPVYEAEVCLGAQEKKTVRALRTISSQAGSPPIGVGTILYADGTRAEGVLLDVYQPNNLVTAEELEALTIPEHTAVDYRGDYLSSLLTDADGHYRFVWPTFGGSCFVASLVAPDGFVFTETGSPYLRRSMCPDEVPPPTLVVESASAVG